MYGLVLEGGGTRGAYQVGAYKAIMEEGLKIKGVVGTSIGALNGALLAQGDYEKLREIWENLNYKMVIEAEEEEIKRLENFKFDKKSISAVKDSLIDIIKEGGLDITPLKEMLDEFVDEEKIRNSDIDFGLVTVNLSDLTPMEIFLEDIPEGSLKSYLLASSYLPIFKSEKLEGKYFLDGAFYDNLPFQMLRDKGYEKLIIIRIHGTGVIKDIDLKDGDILIAPREDLGGGLELDKERSNYNLELGYYDGLKAIRGLDGHKYYIETTGTEDDYFNFFLELPEDKIEALKKVLNLKDGNNRRLLLEEIIPKLAFYLSLDEEATYKDIYIRLMEVLCENLELERFEIYKEEDLLEKIKNTKLKSKKESHEGILDKLVKTVESIATLNKKQILLKSSDIIFR